MSERQVRYWADHGLIAHWRKGSRRLFETVGLITAFSVTNASQHELQFYRGLVEDPVAKLTAKVGILSSLLATRLADLETSEAEELTAPLAELTHR
jgi:DNA-binding transcriptional MerR regulator